MDEAAFGSAATIISDMAANHEKRRTTSVSQEPHRPTAISLFSGGGGLDIGIEQAGFQTLCCIEVDPNCCETLAFNQGEYLASAKIVHADVRTVSPRALMKELRLAPGDLAFLYGGPPCQTFSQIGKQGSLGDDRGMLLFEMIRFAKSFRPKAILIENVKGLATAKDLNGVRGAVLSGVLSELRKLGYEVQSKVLNAADYGVAQLRRRLFIVAMKRGMKFQFPEPSHGPSAKKAHLTIRHALKGLGKPAAKDRSCAKTKNNHVDITPEGDRRRISYVKEGSYLAAMDAPASIKCRLSKKDTTKFLRLARDGQSKTLRCGEIFFHPVDDRYLTPREYMRIHGFPDTYSLKGPIRGRSGSVRNLDQHRQVANSVPPPMAHAVAMNVLSSLLEAEKNG